MFGALLPATIAGTHEGDYRKIGRAGRSESLSTECFALAAIVVVTSAVGADPRDLDIFGVKPPNYWGVQVLGAATILAHLNLYVLRFYHLRDDGRIEQSAVLSGTKTDDLKINLNDFTLVRRGANLFSNWAAFVLTGLSWWFIGLWIVSGPPQKNLQTAPPAFRFARGTRIATFGV